MFWLFKKYNYLKSKKSHPSLFKGGFTLLELIVVILIMTIMTIVILTNLPAFRSQTELDLIAQEVAITIRQAQSYGAASRGPTGTATINKDAYGIFINKLDNSLILFKDIPVPGSDIGDDRYDSSGDCGNPGVECVEKFSFRGGIRIVNMNPDIDQASIIFRRPDLEPNFLYNNGSDIDIGSLKIIIGKEPTSDSENQRQIEVWNTGHIYATRVNTTGP